MDVFYGQYNTYRILLSVLGLWPYHKSIYSTIHRILISVIMLAYLVLQVQSLFKPDITFRGCIVTLSTTCPVMVFFMRYVSAVAMFPVNVYIFDNLRKIDTTLKDELEVQILMKYVDCATYIISIFLCLCCSWILFATMYVFAPITLDLLLPLNESRRRYFSYLSMFSHDQIVYVDIVYVNILFVYTIGLLCLAGTELTLVVFAHWMCGMFDVTSYRLRKTIADLSSSRQVEPNFRDFRHVVDCHRNTIQIIDYALSNYMLHYIPPCSVCLVIFSVFLHRVSILSFLHVLEKRFLEFSAQTFFSKRSEMDVFYGQYNTYRILLSVLGLWPYHKSIYSTIHRILISVIMFAYIVFEVLSLFKSGITFRGCIVTLSSTCPVVIYFMRYVTFVAVFPVTKYIFDTLRTTDTTLKDQLEDQILMKYVDYSSYILSISLCKETFSMFIEFVAVIAIILMSKYFAPNIM
ncbi:uncharacterized protein LOC117164865 [Bombus vancouverensis nearcticus]|uniref:uncharacterized protein LOC117164865 n=1 Tax=Bombus vancouverensis nearcticus TaxID=2705178 RepID=UPI00402B0CCF